MEYKIQDIENAFVGEITENLGNSEYIIKINDNDHQIKILTMDAKGIEFLLDQKYHKAKYLENSTNEFNLVIDNVPVTINQHTNFDEIVYKNSGGSGPGEGQLALKSQIPGKVVSIAVQDGDTVNQGDVVCTLESMKMQVAVKAHKAGSIKSIKIKDGASVAKGDVIAEIE
ncbi:MAG: acetyl-CoA carboxylase biotin carboxyl carrier protein subunit [Nitrosopumilaceae archaeon]|uniref:Acetyl-CoA carboxylase biotin carboxyl carrier protein subunit n=1 Tax=Candidatus Nitrosomaritimum aestuariumsis TaxID=3342354 RepID=A0AC60W9T1_9ARCH|nr:acetyl-CoA carboxylase biotin carboxyl carrier protein subunit [Nitrosopumilaceae archaeon]MBA4461763.1 acetyl-CoA carboxylase biotin carboxyl carrier protein subunit [Nitrosopumilaceae archaeon]MBA4463631.1 acetyl-CoA carboxylase biotin carboxyl carrier protein subunit [Nitrosopumilaceae archaeon]